MNILITGSTGKTGLAIIRALAPQGATIIGMVRPDSNPDLVIGAGASKIAWADFSDSSSYSKMLSGIDTVYHICSNMNPAEFVIGRDLIDAAKKCQVERFIYHSVIHPQVSKMAHHWQKVQVEEYLFESGMSYTILQPTAYMQNLLGYKDQILAGKLVLPYDPSAKISMLEINDLGEAAARIITDRSYDYGTYELCSTYPISHIEIAAKVSDRTGHPVFVQKQSISSWQESVRTSQMSNYSIQTLSSMFSYYDRYGLPGNPTVLTAILSHSPSTLDSFITQIFGEVDG